MNDNDLNTRPFWARAFRGESQASLKDALAVLAGLLDDVDAFKGCAEAVRIRQYGRWPRVVQRHEAILEEVAGKYGVSVADLKGRSQSRIYTRPRQEAYFRLRVEMDVSYPWIAFIMKKKDHTTVSYGVREHVKRMTQEERDEYGDRLPAVWQNRKRRKRQQATSVVDQEASSVRVMPPHIHDVRDCASA